MSYFVFTVSSWHESSRPEVLCISGAVNWLPPSSASGGRSSDNVGCRPGGSIRHPPELIILWITDRLLKKKRGRKNWFGFDKCVLTCRRIYATFQPEVFRKATYLQLFTYLHQSHWVLWGGFDVVDSLTTRLRKSNTPSWRVISHCSMNPFVILGQN